MTEGIRWITRVVMTQAHAWMPSDRGEWAEAMSAEADYLPDDLAALEFAAGCYRAAMMARLRELSHRSTGYVGTGIVAGMLFLGHAMVPESRSWPWVWPAAAGFLAALEPMRDGAPGNVWLAAKAGARTGAVCGLLFLAGAVAVISYAERAWGVPLMADSLPTIVRGSAGAFMLAPLTAAMTRALARE